MNVTHTPIMSLLIALLAATLCSTLLTYALRRYAIHKHILDIPNERSSHSAPTPRGGGLAIVITFLIGLLGIGITGMINWPTILGIGIASGMIASIGFLDDKGHVTPKWRLLVHFLSAIILVYTLGGLPPLLFFGFPVNFGWLGHVLATVAVVWILNLFNFMDGIDGIASIEALTAVGVLASLSFGVATGVSTMTLLLGAAVLGFLFWNFPPAKIFMGDAGSGFLGFMMAAILLAYTNVSPTLFWSGLIMLGIFVVDATLTLFRRLFSGKKIYEAHRSHAYQHAAQYYGKHRPVTMTVLGINLLWLTPLAFFVARGALDGAIGLCIAYVPLLILAYRFNAGKIAI